MEEVIINQNKKKKMSASRLLFIISFTIIPTLNFLVFYVYVNISSIFMAFRQTKGGITFWTLNNFQMFFAEFSKPTSLIREAFRNTAITFGIQEALFIVGFLVSYFLYKKILFYRQIRTLFFLPGLLAGTVVSSFVIQLFGTEGPIAPVIQKLFNLEELPALLQDSRYANYSIFGEYIWFGIPGNMIIWGGAFSRIPDSLIESGRLDGVNWIQEATRIIVPIIWPQFALLLILSFVGFFSATGSVFLLTQGELGTMTVSCWLYLQLYNNVGNVEASNVYNYMSAIGLIMTAFTMVVVVITRTITSKLFSGVEY